jgi:hypothetical protein
MVRSSTSEMPLYSALPAEVTNSRRRVAKSSTHLSKCGRIAPAAWKIAPGTFSLAWVRMSPAIFDLSTIARIGAASVSRPPASTLTKIISVVPSAPTA